MVSCVRNFWVEVNVDGRNTKVGTGPKAGDGGLTVHLKQRDQGSIVDILTLSCRASGGWHDETGVKLRTSIKLDDDAIQLLRQGGEIGDESIDPTILVVHTYRDGTEELKDKEVSRLKRRLNDDQRYALGEARRAVTALRRTMKELPHEMRQALINSIMADML